MFRKIFALSVISMCYSSVRFMQQQIKLMIVPKNHPKDLWIIFGYAWLNNEYLLCNIGFC